MKSSSESSPSRLSPFRFHTLDVFTDRQFSGNPLAVFPDAVGLTTTRMQQIARELNLSETAFVFPPKTREGTRWVRIFTPQIELPFAGHPTIGTAHLLCSLGAVDGAGDEIHLILEEEAGPVSVTVRMQRMVPVFTQLSVARRPEFGPAAPSVSDIAASLSLAPDEIGSGELRPQAVSCGVPFLIVPLKNRDSLERAHLVLAEWQRRIRDHWAPHLYAFTFDDDERDSTAGPVLRARMFAPAAGILEDPATGAAAVALAAYLGALVPEPNCARRWKILQGVEMNRPSVLHVEAQRREGKILSLAVGGSCIAVGEGTMFLSEKDVPMTRP